ncbi:MAG: hypothetical protein AAF570_04670 [Bacteroidota bacterium]
MKKNVTFGLVFSMLVGLFVMQSCKSYNRNRTINSGDHNVTIVRKPKRRRIKNNVKPVTSRKYNRAPKR